MSPRETIAALVDAASAPYRPIDLFAYYRARGKLRGDPVFAGILKEGWLLGADRILDLGCGQGLLAAWLLAARARIDEQPQSWPGDWSPTPRPTSIRGIERSEREVQRARDALGVQAEFELGDIAAAADFGTADAVVILDVLHYIEFQAQRDVLDRVRTALAPNGVLVVRVSDAGSGVRFAIGKYIDQTVMLTCYHKAPRVYCRPIRDWLGILASAGFHSEALPMSVGTPFANILLIARPLRRASAQHPMTHSLIA
jgi:SAM-dependent methyltransferase